MNIDEALAVGEHIDVVRREEGDVRALEVCFASIAASVVMLEDLIGGMNVATIMIGIARRSSRLSVGSLKHQSMMRDTK